MCSCVLFDDPRLEDGGVTYLGQNQYTRKWERQRTWGGKICENLVQAVARDILAQGLLNAAQKGLTIIGHVHDEILVETRQDAAEPVLEALIGAMTAVPSWAPGLRLKAEGYTAHRYRKG